MLLDENNSLLRQKMPYYDFTENKADLYKLKEEMLECMRIHSGIGLAAPQIGLEYRLFVMLHNNKDYMCINPEILEKDTEEIKIQEGCLSFKNLYVNIYRPNKIKVKFQNEKGDIIETYFDGILSRIFQHELDHLNGILFVDKASRLSLKMAKDKRRKLQKRKK